MIGAYVGTLAFWFMPRKYGFIRPDPPIPGLPADADIFVHIADMPDHHTLPKYTRLTFDIATFRDRPKAVNVAREVVFRRATAPIVPTTKANAGDLR